MHVSIPVTKDIVLIGGGHTHALVLKSWGMAPLPGARLTLITPGPTAAYSGMLPGHIAGHYPRNALDIDLVKLARFAGARIILGAATGLDPVTRMIRVTGRGPVGYDLVSADIGVHSRMARLPGFSDFGAPVKPLDHFADRWQDFVTGGGGPVAVIGAGVAGAELAMAARRRLGDNVSITLLDRAGILDAVNEKARTRLLAELDHQKIILKPNSDVTQVNADHLVLADNTAIPSALTLGAASARPHAWLAEQGLPHQAGFLSVGPTLQSIGDEAVFAVGDCAHLAHAPRPKAGVYAVRAAPILLNNLRALAQEKPELMRPFNPQRDYLKLISLGDRRALAEKAGIVVAGRALWRWKNNIDLAFMQKFSRLKPMAQPLLPVEAAAGTSEALGDKPLCGGCGAKIGLGGLKTALKSLPPITRDDVESLPGDDAAILSMGKTRQILTTDHLRAFTLDPALLARITAIHALGDCWAMGAAPQAALAQIILPRLSPALQSRWLEEIMSASSDVFSDAGASIVGGHSSMGAELTIGFSVTGTTNSAPITLNGANPGDALLLTKPLGTGVVLAAEMQLAAPGDVVAKTWAQMATSSASAAKILSLEAHAMTDVTGFGLAGHLFNICEASKVGAQLNLRDIPVIPGAENLLAHGYKSSLHAANFTALAPRIRGAVAEAADILFDPQTSGGLLAAVPAAKVPKIQASLSEAGIPGIQIGTVLAGSPEIHIIDGRK